MHVSVRTRLATVKLCIKTHRRLRKGVRYYEKELGTTTVWNEALGNGNPFKSELVSQYMAFTREEQKKAGVLVKQAPALLQSHLSKITALLQAQLRRSTDPLIRVTLARDIAVFHGSISVRQKGETNLLVRS